MNGCFGYNKLHIIVLNYFGCLLISDIVYILYALIMRTNPLINYSIHQSASTHSPIINKQIR